MFKYDNPLAGKVSPMGSGQITDLLDKAVEVTRAELNEDLARYNEHFSEPAGVWVTWQLDDKVGAYVTGVYATELDALRVAIAFSQVRVGFLPFGCSPYELRKTSSDRSEVV